MDLKSIAVNLATSLQISLIHTCTLYGMHGYTKLSNEEWAGNYKLCSTGPSGAPTNVTIVSVSATSIHLFWDHPPEDTHQGIIREYRINVTELETGTMFREVTPAETTEVVLDSLHPYYTYEIVIVAFTVEEGSNYTTVTIQTDEEG